MVVLELVTPLELFEELLVVFVDKFVGGLLGVLEFVAEELFDEV